MLSKSHLVAHSVRNGLKPILKGEKKLQNSIQLKDSDLQRKVNETKANESEKERSSGGVLRCYTLCVCVLCAEEDISLKGTVC